MCRVCFVVISGRAGDAHQDLDLHTRAHNVGWVEEDVHAGVEEHIEAQKLRVHGLSTHGAYEGTLTGSR